MYFADQINDFHSDFFKCVSITKNMFNLSICKISNLNTFTSSFCLSYSSTCTGSTHNFYYYVFLSSFCSYHEIPLFKSSKWYLYIHQSVYETARITLLSFSFFHWYLFWYLFSFFFFFKLIILCFLLDQHYKNITDFFSI